jgi:hypothetical protein
VVHNPKNAVVAADCEVTGAMCSGEPDVKSERNY